MENKDQFEEWTYDKFEHIAQLLQKTSIQLQNQVSIMQRMQSRIKDMDGQLKALFDLCNMQQDQIVNLKKRTIDLEVGYDIAQERINSLQKEQPGT